MIKTIVKGMIIGLANIIPGVSGGTMAVSMGIYDRLIHCVTHFFSDLKSNLIFLAPILFGMGIAIIASSFGIDYMFEAFPIETNFLFIGLIMGGLPVIYNQVKTKPFKISYIVVAIAFLSLVVGMASLNGDGGREVVITTSFSQMVILFLIGVIASGTMVVPGVSGSMMLLVLGYYNPILEYIQNFVVGLVTMDFEMLLQSVIVLIPFGIGVLAGIIIIAKLIEIIFQRFPTYAYWSIIGLLIGSPIAILMVGDFPRLTFIHTLAAIITFLSGWFVADKLGA